MKTYSFHQNAALFTLRLIIAAIFLYAGYAKLSFWGVAPEGLSVGMVTLSKFLSIVEPLGALALLIGFLTRWAAGGLAIIMLGAIFVLEFSMQIGFATAAGAGWNFPLMILAGCLVLMSFGAGTWALDELWGRGRQN